MGFLWTDDFITERKLAIRGSRLARATGSAPLPERMLREFITDLWQQVNVWPALTSSRWWPTVVGSGAAHLSLYKRCGARLAVAMGAFPQDLTVGVEADGLVMIVHMSAAAVRVDTTLGTFLLDVTNPGCPESQPAKVLEWTLRQLKIFLA